MKTILYLLAVIIALFLQTKGYSQAPCNCGEDDLHQQLNISDAKKDFTFQAACIASYMGQQYIIFCISNNTNKEVHIYAETWVKTTRGGEINLGKIDDMIDANKSGRTGWTSALSYVIIDSEIAKHGKITGVSKMRVWIDDSQEKLEQKQREEQAQLEMQRQQDQQKQAQAAHNSHLAKARAYEDSGNLTEAENEYRTALSLNPESFEAKNGITRVQEKGRQQRLDAEIKKNEEAQRQRNETQAAQTTAYAGALSAAGLAFFSDIERSPTDKILNGGSMRINASIGLGSLFAPQYTNDISSIYDGNNYQYNYSSGTTENVTFGLDAGVQFWPYYGNLAGFGLFGEGYFGIMPLSGGSYTALSYGFGPQVYFGTDRIKAIGSYLWGSRSLTYSSESSAYSSEFLYSGDSQVSFNRFSIGTRISFIIWESYGMLDLMFFNEKVESLDQLDQLSAKGLSISLSAHKRLRIAVDFAWQYPVTGIVEYELDEDAATEKFYLKFSVIRSWDWFKKY